MPDKITQREHCFLLLLALLRLGHICMEDCRQVALLLFDSVPYNTFSLFVCQLEREVSLVIFIMFNHVELEALR
jgi:hypothetical protein